MLLGQVTLGGVVSTILTVKVQLAETPALSVAVQTTLLTPNRKPVPEGGTQITGMGLPEASTAVTVYVTGVSPPVHSATMLEGHLIVGGAPCDLTVIVKLHELELPTVSVAVQTTMFVPTGKTLPEGGAQANPERPQASVAAAI